MSSKAHRRPSIRSRKFQCRNPNLCLTSNCLPLTPARKRAYMQKCKLAQAGLRGFLSHPAEWGDSGSRDWRRNGQSTRPNEYFSPCSYNRFATVDFQMDMVAR